MHQALRYAQNAGKWTYTDIEEKFKEYSKQHPQQTISNYDKLTDAHKEAFNLNLALNKWDFNKKQHLIVVGSASDEALVNAVDYWKKQSISIEFLPYRIYKIGDQEYFEFFALPFDRHSNPGAIKGVLFDTNERYEPGCIWEMMEKKRVIAYGDAKRFVGYVHPNDIIFFYHKGHGVVAAAKVKRGDIKKPNEEEWYREVEFLTKVPKKPEKIKAMPIQKVVEITTGYSFFMPPTIKVPYLSKTQANNLLIELKKYLEENQ